MLNVAQCFKRFFLAAVVVVQDHMRFADRQLVPFAPHRFDQHGQMQDASSGDGEGVGACERPDLQRDVTLQFPHEPLPQLPSRDVLAVAPGKRGTIDGEDHLQRRFIDLQSG